jgi:hypothetical protein
VQDRGAEREEAVVDVVPDVVVDPPPGWRSWREGATLRLAPGNGSGVLQLSSPARSTGWRRGDLPALVGDRVVDAGPGSALRVEAGAGDYGPFGRAECAHDRYGDVCAWVLAPETHDPLWITWVADARSADRDRARDLVGALRPGPFSVVVASAVRDVRADIAATGRVEPVVLLHSHGGTAAVRLPLPPGDHRAAVRAIRGERRQRAADVVVQVTAEYALRTSWEEEKVALLHAQSASRRKCFMVPAPGDHREVCELPGVAALRPDLFA